MCKGIKKVKLMFRLTDDMRRTNTKETGTVQPEKEITARGLTEVHKTRRGLEKMNKKSVFLIFHKTKFRGTHRSD